MTLIVDDRIAHLQYQQGKRDADGDAKLAGEDSAMMRMTFGCKVTHVSSQQPTQGCSANKVCQ